MVRESLQPTPPPFLGKSEKDVDDHDKASHDEK
jgi:hypothetical protein